MGRFSSDSRGRRLALAVLVYVLATVVYFSFASRSTLRSHTPWNHFALLAEAWLDGRLDLGGPPPGYAGNNDFSQYEGKWYVTFPPFPAVLLLPLVKFAGSAQKVQDGQFFIWLAGIGPAVLFLVLEKLRRMGHGRSTHTNFLLAGLFAFGTVYFFTAEQGTVWFAAHVVAVALAGLYLLFALDAERPVLAGLVLGLAFITRTPLLFAVPLFALEALRVATRRAPETPVQDHPPEQLALPLEPESGQLELALPKDRAQAAPALKVAPSGLRSRALAFALASWKRIDKRRLLKAYASFALPLALVLSVVMIHNHARFDSPFEFGYRYLTVGWRPRMEKWGLFDYHYLGRNLGVVLTSLPWWNGLSAPAPFQINQHGLALWITTPAFLWLLWPRRTESPHLALCLTVAAVAVPTLFYQNTGWLQFGYRFSNDYAVFLFALLAIGGYRFRALFWACAIWAIAVNGFGARTFGRAEWQRFYYQDATQRVFYQPD